MDTSKVKLRDLCFLEDTDMMKIVLSSGDYFPGFYRFTMGTQFIGEESLNLGTLIWLYLYQESTHHYFHREDWLELQHEIHDREIASERARNAGNFPHVREMFTERMMNWYTEASGFDLIYLDTTKKIDKFEIEKTYYFMGSLVRFENDHFMIGYNDITKQNTIDLKVGESNFFKYLNEVYSNEQISDLFIEAEIVAELLFNDCSQLGKINLDDSKIDSYLLKSIEGKLLAAPINSRDLPMRFAKTIRLTNFRRGGDGAFEPWRTNQNW